MDYKRFEDTIVVRLNIGEEIIESLKSICLKENVKLAQISGIGATDDFTVGVFHVNEKKYHPITYKGDHEIVALVGNITTKDGEYYSHLHLSAGNTDGNIVGGHLNRAVISVTSEIFITVINGTVDRKTDKLLGINMLDFDK